jgi:hypothetical protein
MASSSRLFLLFALVAILLLGASAQNGTPARRRRGRGGRCRVPRGAPWNTCSRCTGTGNGRICTGCKVKNAVVNDDENGCVCPEGFGTITPKLYKEFCLNSDSEAHGGGNGNGRIKTPKGCYNCEKLCEGLVAVNGKCIEEISAGFGRRLFAADEDIWV